jgi:signal transduction histidine kinase
MKQKTGSRISTIVFLGFGSILMLLLVVASVSLISLFRADQNFKQYRALAQQTNAEGRVQANMLMTQLHAKDFVISANRDNIKGVRERAETTILMIKKARALETKESDILVIDDLAKELNNYAAQFNDVTDKQAERDELVKKTLDVIGPRMEQNLTTIMETAFINDNKEVGFRPGIFRPGITLRNLLLARIYVAKFLIQNDEESYQRVGLEFQKMDKNLDTLLDNLSNDTPLHQLALTVKNDQLLYMRAFEKVHQIITTRNDIIQNQLNNIGPRVANSIEQLKLQLKQDQDELGPQAEAEIDKSVMITLGVSIVSIGVGILGAWYIGSGISRPINAMSKSMRELAEGNTDVDIQRSNKHTEIIDMSEAVLVFKTNLIRINQLIDEQHQAAAEIREAKEAADAANLAKSSFLANMSHELRTPMNAILGYSEMLIEDAEESEQKEYVPDLKKINQSGRHLLNLINDVLDLSKIESGKMTVYAEEFDVNALVDTISTMTQPLLSNNENILKVVCKNNLGHASQDLTKLRQSLLNLMSNAAKFTTKGLITLYAEHSQEGNLIFRVEDNGIGIPPEKMGRIFEEFSQADDSTTRDYGGTGLGLSISRRFARMLGGELTAKSELGSGSVFSLIIPDQLKDSPTQKNLSTAHHIQGDQARERN